MGEIRQVDTILGTIYERYDSEGNVIQRAGAIGFSKNYEGKIEDYVGKTFFIITSLDGKAISEANRYLNFTLGGCSYKKRELAFTALKIFYSFVDLYHILKYKDGLDMDSINKLKDFLKGGKRKGISWNLDFETLRINKTINNYLSAYRDFYSKAFNLRDTLLHDKSIFSSKTTPSKTGSKTKDVRERFNSNKRVKIVVDRPPKYIKQKEYDSIIRIIKDGYSNRELIMVKLMYKYGLRLGEVLGITLEDLILEENKIILRNRLSDKPWQRTKKRDDNLESIEDYSSPDYQNDYFPIYIDKNTMELIQEYIEETRDETVINKSEIKKRNLETKCRADKVTDRELLYDENQYIFLNEQHYTPLTSSGWNFILRQIYEKVGIKIDKRVKKNNLSHRLRHGFAMYKVWVKGYDELALADALRHSDTSTVKRYFNPDDEDRARLLREQREHMKNKVGISFGSD